MCCKKNFTRTRNLYVMHFLSRSCNFFGSFFRPPLISLAIARALVNYLQRGKIYNIKSHYFDLLTFISFFSLVFTMHLFINILLLSPLSPRPLVQFNLLHWLFVLDASRHLLPYVSLSLCVSLFPVSRKRAARCFLSLIQQI